MRSPRPPQSNAASQERSDESGSNARIGVKDKAKKWYEGQCVGRYSSPSPSLSFLPDERAHLAEVQPMSARPKRPLLH